MINKILIIEKNDSLRNQCASVLSLAGYQVIKAENGKLGVEIAKDQIPNLIICGEKLDELDGFAVLKILSKDDALRRVPVIFVSTEMCHKIYRKVMSLGADDYLKTPIKDVDLLQAVETRINKFRFFNVDNLHEKSSNIDTMFNMRNAKSKLKSLYNEEHIHNFNNKESLYHIGGTPHYFYWLKKGKIKTYMINDNGKELITGLYGPGDFVGLIDLFGNNIYVENAKFIENGTCVTIGRKSFLEAISVDRDIAMFVYSKLNFSVNIRKERLLYMAYNSVRKRTADCLLWLCFVYNKEDTYPFHINFTREDLAALVGTAKESVIRMLSSFKDEGLIETHSTELVILDKYELKNVIA